MLSIAGRATLLMKEHALWWSLKASCLLWETTATTPATAATGDSFRCATSLVSHCLCTGLMTLPLLAGSTGTWATASTSTHRLSGISSREHGGSAPECGWGGIAISFWLLAVSQNIFLPLILADSADFHQISGKDFWRTRWLGERGNIACRESPLHICL